MAGGKPIIVRSLIGAVGVDIFYFTRTNQRRVYAAPDRAADATVIAAGYSPHVSWVTGQVGDYIEISSFNWGDEGGEQFVPVGWIRIHDDDDRLTV